MKKRIITGFIKKEFKQIIRDKKMILVLCFLPTVQTILFGLALTNEVKNIKLVTMAKPNDAIAQKIKEKTLASGWFKKVKNVDTADFSKAENLLLSRKAEAILIAPKEGFLHGIERNKPIQLLIDATNAARARQTDAYIKTIISQVVQERNTKSNISSLIEIDIRVLYNHNLNTAPFMIPAISVLSTFMVIMLVCCMAVTKEKEQGTMEKLISSPATLVEIIVGKTLPYIFIGVFLVCFIIFVGVVTMDVPLRGCLWQIFVTAIFFILTALSLAIIVSTMANNQQQAMMGCFIFLLPAILLSGIMFPVENIPYYIRWITYLNPIMYAVKNLRYTMLKGGDLMLFWQYCFILLFMAVSISIIGVKKFKATI